MGRRRRFDAYGVKNVRLALSEVKVNDRRQIGIEILTDKPLIFGTLLKARQKQYMAAVLWQRLRPKDE